MKTFFLIFLTKNHNTRVSTLLSTCKRKYGNKGIPSCVLTQGMTLSKAGFGSLHLFWDWMTLKALKLFPTVVHARLVGHPDPHPLQATNGKGSIWVEVFHEPMRRFSPHESWLLISPKFPMARATASRCECVQSVLNKWMCEKGQKKILQILQNRHLTIY